MMNSKQRRIRLTKEFKFEMAHALHGYDGVCANIHGHSYQLSVTIIGEAKNMKDHPKNGMLMDFGELKKVINSQIIDVFDHSLILSNLDPLYETLSRSYSNFRILPMSYQPTCENMIVDFSERIIHSLPDEISLYSLKLQETSTSYAEWYAEDNKQV